MDEKITHITAYKLVEGVPIKIYGKVQTVIPEVHYSRIQQISNAFKMPVRIEEKDRTWTIYPHHSLCCEGGKQ